MQKYAANTLTKERILSVRGNLKGMKFDYLLEREHSIGIDSEAWACISM